MLLAQTYKHTFAYKSLSYKKIGSFFAGCMKSFSNKKREMHFLDESLLGNFHFPSRPLDDIVKCLKLKAGGFIRFIECWKRSFNLIKFKKLFYDIEIHLLWVYSVGC